jgi:hypothetical protein
LDYIHNETNHPVCVTGMVNMPYIYVLFIEKPNPLEYLNTVEYIDPEAGFRKVRAFGRYTFGLENCQPTPNTIYILRNDEKLPLPVASYKTHEFGIYSVYIP